MTELMEADSNLTAYNAALAVVDRAQGTDSIPNRAKRLERKWKLLQKKGQ
jgi:hypothetical protein